MSGVSCYLPAVVNGMRVVTVSKHSALPSVGRRRQGSREISPRFQSRSSKWSGFFTCSCGHPYRRCRLMHFVRGTPFYLNCDQFLSLSELLSFPHCPQRTIRLMSHNCISGVVRYESHEGSGGQPASECQMYSSRSPYYNQPPSGDSASPAGEPSAETSSRRFQHQERRTPQPRGHILAYRRAVDGNHSRDSLNEASSTPSSRHPGGRGVPYSTHRAAPQFAANGGKAQENAGKFSAMTPPHPPGRTDAHSHAPASPATSRSRSTGSRRSSRSGRGSMRKVAEEAWGIYGFSTHGEDRSRGSVDDPKVTLIRFRFVFLLML